MIDPVSPPSAGWTLLVAFGGSVIGALISSSVSVLVHKRVLKAAEKQREAERKDKRLKACFAIFIKLQQIVSDFRNLNREIQSSIEVATKAGGKGKHFQFVRPIAPLPRLVHFTSEELAIVYELKDQLFNEMVALDQLHESAIALLKLFATKREEAFAYLTPSADLQSAALDPSKAAAYNVRAKEAEDLLGGLLGQLSDGQKQSAKSLVDLHSAMGKEFGMRWTLHLKAGVI